MPGATRYWDGERWTTQAQAPAPEPQPAPDAHRGAGEHGGADAQRGYGATGWGAPAARDGEQSGHPEGMPWAGSDRTGEPASWGARVGAYLLDAIPLVIVTMVLLSMLGVYDAMNTAIEAGDAAMIDEATAMMSPLSPTGMTVTIANLVFVALYNIGFHVSRGQTPGKMLVGIRVRLADEDRNPDLRAAGIRWLVQFGPSLLNGIPGVGFLAGVFSIVDHAWPLWDAQNQAIHDKAARTVVVRAR